MCHNGPWEGWSPWTQQMFEAWCMTMKKRLEDGSGKEWIIDVTQVEDNVVICVDNFIDESFWIIIMTRGFA